MDKTFWNFIITVTRQNYHNYMDKIWSQTEKKRVQELENIHTATIFHSYRMLKVATCIVY